MKILVLSDSHGFARRALKVAAREQDADACIFLGDGREDADLLHESYPNLPLYRVIGNTDYASDDPYTGLAPFAGHLVFYTHGHTFGVRSGHEALWQAAKAAGADVALYGHTHVGVAEDMGGILIANPGSIGLPRDGKGYSYGILTLEAGCPPAFERRYL